MAEFAGIDISKWNADIDYTALYDAKIEGRKLEFAMLRFSYGTHVDTLFTKHYFGCKGAGLKVGAYHWLMAKTPAEARTEAQWLAEQLKAFRFDYPIALDFEDSELLALKLTKSQYAAIISAFMNVLTAENYTVVLYTSPSILDSSLPTSFRNRYDLWLAHWTGTPKKYGQRMWQYAALGTAEEVEKKWATKVGTVAGINGPVDVNISYVDYAEKISRSGKNRPVVTYTVTGTKTVRKAELNSAQGKLRALGYEVAVIKNE